jgi:hypothetical protein
MNKAAIIALSLALSTAASAKTAPPAKQAPAAPDPRRGERLDGRAPYRDPYRYAFFVPRAVLLLPRVFAYAILAPATAATEYVEEKHLWTRAERFLTTNDGLIGVRPTAHYESGFLPSVGLRWYDRRTLGVGTRMSASFRTAGARLFDVDVAVRPSRLPLELRAEFERDPNAVFGGANGESRDDLEAQGRNVARYSFDRLDAALAWEKRPSQYLYYAIAVDAVHADYGNGDARSGDSEIVDVFCTNPGTAGCMTVDDDLVPGFNTGLRLFGASAVFAWDSRGNERFATGIMLRMAARFAEGAGVDPSRHASAEATLCTSRAIGERQLELCGQAGLVEPLGDAPVPFDELMSPGGSRGIRAVPGGRLRGHSMMIGSAEYRWLLGSWIDAGVFVDVGGAFGRHFEDFSTDRLVPGGGIALRYVRHESRFYYWRAVPVAGFQLAWGPQDGFRLLFSVTH